MATCRDSEDGANPVSTGGLPRLAGNFFSDADGLRQQRKILPSLELPQILFARLQLLT
jgi:hypothetical protein